RPLESSEDKKKSNSDDAAAPLKIDLDGIEDRVIAFPVPEGKFNRVLGVKGRGLFSWFPVEGSRGHDWTDTTPSAKDALDYYEADTQKHERMAESVTDFWLGADGKTLLYQSGYWFRVLKANQKPPEQKGTPNKPGRQTGWIDTARIKVSVLPTAEYRQMFREA